MKIFILTLTAAVLSVSFVWAAEVKISASDIEAGDNFGVSVAISGEGAAYIFIRSGTSWTQQAKITASDAAAYDYFGHSVSISGAYAIVGAYLEDAGAAYIYESGSDLSLPVELASFSAIAGDGLVTLKWTTASELDNEAFILERSADGETFELLTEIKGQGSTSSETNYSFTDNAVFNGFTYFYRLADRDINGILTYHKTINATPNAEGIAFEQTGVIVDKFSLHSSYPNPFNPETTIRFDVPTANSGLYNIKLNIYNSLGQLVTTLYEGQISGGQYEMKWSAAGQPSGVYFLNFQSERFVQSQKMILMR